MNSESSSNTKISDSGISQSCSNSTSHQSGDLRLRQFPKHNDDFEHKKKGTCPPTTNDSDYINENTSLIQTTDNNQEDACGQFFTTWKEFAEDVTLDKNFPSTDPIYQHDVQDGFTCVISMYDGIVLYTSPSLTTVLGAPKNTWLGNSFIDFIHPKDKQTFSSQVSCIVAMLSFDSVEKVKDHRNLVYVYLKRHRTKVPLDHKRSESYEAFQLTLTIKEMEYSEESLQTNKESKVFLVVLAVPLYSTYKVAEERIVSNQFGMRHTASCLFTHVDPGVVTNFGFLPQDMLGKSVFEFYHPEDMPIIKEIYMNVYKNSQVNGTIYRSKPYRFLAQNGCFIVIETEWSSVVNPWSRKMDFVVGLVRVLQGPLNPNVFDSSDEEPTKICSQVIKQGKVLQAEILQLLAQELPRVSENEKAVTDRCKHVASLMKTMINSPKLENEQTLSRSISERGSVMLGEISPHHEFCDSKTSSETPPSYNQLNYNENISRFFQSNPNTVPSDESNNSASNVMGMSPKNRQDVGQSILDKKDLSPTRNVADESRCDSSGNTSSGSDGNLDSGTSGTSSPTDTSDSNDENNNMHLTASILVRHNEDMEKIMIQRHKKERIHNKDREGKKIHQKMDNFEDDIPFSETHEQNHGVKRSGSDSWKEDNHKQTKQDPIVDVEVMTTRASKTDRYHPLLDNGKPGNMIDASHAVTKKNEPHNWEGFPIPTHSKFQRSAPLECFSSFNTEMFPIYYVPTILPSNVVNNFEESKSYPVQYMPFNYNPFFVGHPIVCTAMPLVPKPMMNPVPSTSNDGMMPISVSTDSHESVKYSPKSFPMRKKYPPWIESVSISDDLIYKYRMTTSDLERTLKADENSLYGANQPSSVDDQLHQLYTELESDGLMKAINLEDRSSNSCCSSSDMNTAFNISGPSSTKKNKQSYDALMMIYEDDSSLPPSATDEFV